jgi:hypothetical protein
MDSLNKRYQLPALQSFKEMAAGVLTKQYNTLYDVQPHLN